MQIPALSPPSSLELCRYVTFLVILFAPSYTGRQWQSQALTLDFTMLSPAPDQPDFHRQGLEVEAPAGVSDLRGLDTGEAVLADETDLRQVLLSSELSPPHLSSVGFGFLFGLVLGKGPPGCWCKISNVPAL